MKILDHGYVELVEHWGSDERFIEAARMSTNNGFKGWGDAETPGDERLLGYLYRNKHFTPFEMGGMVIEVKAPIFVVRQWMRHRTQSHNEMSARYTELPNEDYVPTVERLMMTGGKNKQAGGRVVLSLDGASGFRHCLKYSSEVQQIEYEEALKSGVPRELARLLLPVSRYTRMRASANLRNWLSFLALRLDEHAQWEIRQYAEAVYSLVKEKFPRTSALFAEGLA